MLFSRRRSRFAVAGLVAYVGALIVAVGWFVVNEIAQYQAAQAPQTATAVAGADPRYTGSVVIPADVPGQCRHLEFDNLTGAVREGYRSPCNEDGAPIGNSTMGRLGAIRDAFSKR
jgi:hypothetical protein